jgi:hypothetical protein
MIEASLPHALDRRESLGVAGRRFKSLRGKLEQRLASPWR